jgi:hypothetical protein
MSDQFFEHPVINSPYAYPARHCELDEQGQPTQRIIESRRRADFITPIPKREATGRCVRPSRLRESAAERKVRVRPGAAIDVLASNRSLLRPFSEFIGVRNGLAVTSGAPFPGTRL